MEVENSMARDQARLIQKAKHEAFLRECRQDSNVFIEYCFKDQETGEPVKQAWFHREWQEALDEYHAVMVVAPRGHGKCLAAGTLITLADGSRIPIEEFVGGQVFSIDPDTWKIAISDSPAVIPNGVKSVYRINLRSGRSISATYNHRFLRSDGWVEVQHLSPGHRIAIQRSIPIDGDTLPENDAFLLGFLCGDSSVTGRVGFSCGDEDLVHLVSKMFGDKGWKVAPIPNCKNDYDYRVTCVAGAHSGGPTHWARSYGLLGCDWNTKRVPDSIFTASREDMFLFCLGYFLADGTVNTNRDPQVEYYSINLPLLLDTQELLSRLGIHGTITTKNGRDRNGQHHASYRFTIRGDSFRQFCDLSSRCGITSLNKISKLLDSRNRNVSSGLSSRLDVVESHNLNLPKWRKRKHKTATFRTLNKIKYSCAMSRKLVDSDLLWDEVLSVEYVGEVETYDLTVPDNHCFLANGIVSHNTSQIVGRIVWELGHDQTARFKIVCSTESKAKDRLYEIRMAIEDNERVREVFPDLIPSLDEKDEWGQLAITVMRRSGIRDASVQVVPIGGSASGGRCDYLIVDDACDRKNSIDEPAKRKKVKNTYYSDLLPTLEPNGSIWYICTFWHEDDLNYELHEGSAFHTLNFSIDPSTLEPIWPEKWPKEKILDRKSKMRPEDFLRAYCNIITGKQTQIVRRSWIRYYDILPPRNELLIIQIIDPASSQEEGADFFGHGTMALHEDTGNLYIIDIRQMQIPFPQQITITKEMQKRVGADLVLIENVSYQRVLAQFLTMEGVDHSSDVADGDLMNAVLPVIEIYPIKNKKERLRVASTYQFRGKVLWNPELNPMTGRPSREPEYGDPIGQILSFPRSKNDDMVDVYSYGVIWSFQSGMDYDPKDEVDINFTAIGSRAHGSRQHSSD